MNSKEDEKGEDLIFLTFYNIMRIQLASAIGAIGSTRESYFCEILTDYSSQ